MSEKQERFQKYLNMYHKMVLKNVQNIIDYDLAEDMTQEAFIKLYHRLDCLEDGDVKPWLLVVSANMAKDYLKRNAKYETVSLDAEENAEDEAPTDHILGDSPEDRIIKHEKQEAARNLLRTACDLLYERNPDWYYILIDSNMLEMSSKQIAQVLNMSVSRVNVERMRARQFLHKKLGKEYEDLF